MSKQQLFSIKSPNGKQNLSVEKLANGDLKVTTDFNLDYEVEFMKGIIRHPYSEDVYDCDSFKFYIIPVRNFIQEVYMEDLATLMEECTYENATTTPI